MTPAEIARRLTKAQKAAIYPGPGNPEYARGCPGSMKVLSAAELVKNVNVYSTNGGRSGLLTPLGLLVRAELEKENGA